MAEFVFGWGTAEALRCQPGLLMCWDCGCDGRIAFDASADGLCGCA